MPDRETLLREPVASARAAAERLSIHLHQTPVLSCGSLDRLAGARLQLKAECLQRGGSFKLRGALTKTLSLSAAERERGLITYSSGNHGQAVALAAALTKTNAVVVMPENAPRVKREAVLGYGASVDLVGPSSDERRLRAVELARERGAQRDTAF